MSRQQNVKHADVWPAHTVNRRQPKVQTRRNGSGRNPIDILKSCSVADHRAHLNLSRVEVYTNDLISNRKPQPLSNFKGNTTQTENDGSAAYLKLGRVHQRANTRGHAAADVADFVKRRVFAQLSQPDLRQDGAIGKGRAPRVMQDRCEWPSSSSLCSDLG